MKNRSRISPRVALRTSRLARLVLAASTTMAGLSAPAIAQGARVDAVGADPCRTSRRAACADAPKVKVTEAHGAIAPGDSPISTRARAVARAPRTAMTARERRALERTIAATLRAAARDTGLHVVVSVAERRLWVLAGRDTLRAVDVGVGKDEPLVYGGKRWTFTTPRGIRRVIGKHTRQNWRPPDWAYAEVAREHGLKLATLPSRKPVKLEDGRTLLVRDTVVGLMLPDGFAPLPLDEHIVFDSTLFIPPLATANRRIAGELGAYQLDLGDGYMLHGTPYEESIGTASTHGCVRIGADDLQWLYDHVPVGTRVYLY